MGARKGRHTGEEAGRGAFVSAFHDPLDDWERLYYLPRQVRIAKGGVTMFDLMPWKKATAKNRELAPYQSSPVAQLRDEFDSLFDRFLARWAEPFEEASRGRFWAADVEDNDQEVVVKAEVPGFEPGELDVQVSGNVLTVKAEKKEERKSKEGNGHYEEQRFRTFHRSVTLPAGINPDQVEAHCKNGLLEIHVPKSEQAKGKRIQVKA
jgi:HSP20 family protein